MTIKGVLKLIEEYKEEYKECLSWDVVGAFEQLAFQVEKMVKEDQFRWHDLRENPNDLPEEYHDVYVCVCNRGQRTYNRTWFDGHGWHNATSKRSMRYGKESVIAWREIDPFEVDVDD